MHALVATVVHHPEDARILHRQIRALLDAGHTVTYIAPFRELGVTPWPTLTTVDVPRATGRRRLRALRAARAALAAHAPTADILLVHDPELLLVLPRAETPMVWDVHEDTAASILTKPWVPRPLRRPLMPLARQVERRAERRLHLLLAEDGYRNRFRAPHPVIPNTTHVPEQPPKRVSDGPVVYLGALSMARGAAELVQIAHRIRPHGVRMDVIGPADSEARPLLRQAQRDGVLDWYGYVPNDQALRMVRGALAGLCLLHDTPNYRRSLPTKVVEYMAQGVPVVTTPNPQAQGLVTGQTQGHCGTVVPYRSPDSAAAALLRLRGNPGLRYAYGRTGHRIAREYFHWPVQAAQFVASLEDWAGVAPARAPAARPDPGPAASGAVPNPGSAGSGIDPLRVHPS
ncbi:glycosyltransferase [Lipingzhangella sp. LS1_29]|uniref:Glycosyltransferase n=1 Tax=Lipingzhangella rawalii TaxID=2055835 RepID=A0ABU2H410_9ACTN|nr:glycosyltransferase [Lipingzhangella rawalii]MDS1269732.1 glycosyltransferase [Lipingzhangella rawalii]